MLARTRLFWTGNGIGWLSKVISPHGDGLWGVDTKIMKKQRPLKFRAWDLITKEWIGDSGTTFTSENPREGVVALSLGGHLRVFSATCIRGEKEEDDLIGVSHSEFGSIHPCETKPSYKRQYILMQYTGRKDKNGVGKEIYEGDIVKFTGGINYRDNVGVIEYTGRAYWRVALQDELDSGLHLHLADSLEVIGNVYESPELLENK